MFQGIFPHSLWFFSSKCLTMAANVLFVRVTRGIFAVEVVDGFEKMPTGTRSPNVVYSFWRSSYKRPLLAMFCSIDLLISRLLLALNSSHWMFEEVHFVDQGGGCFRLHGKYWWHWKSQQFFSWKIKWWVKKDFSQCPDIFWCIGCIILFLDEVVVEAALVWFTVSVSVEFQYVVFSFISDLTRCKVSTKWSFGLVRPSLKFFSPFRSRTATLNMSESYAQLKQSH